MLTLWGAFGEQWSRNHKVDFDGYRRRITISEQVSNIDIKTDIYSDWKEWVQLYDNAKYLPAIRTIGGDPVGGGLFAGDLYFLINGWRIEVNKPVQVNGILYNDEEGVSPYIVFGEGSVIASVSNLAYAVSTLTDTSNEELILDKLTEIMGILSGVSLETTSQKALKAATMAAALSV